MTFRYREVIRFKTSVDHDLLILNKEHVPRNPDPLLEIIDFYTACIEVSYMHFYELSDDTWTSCGAMNNPCRTHENPCPCRPHPCRRDDRILRQTRDPACTILSVTKDMGSRSKQDLLYMIGRSRAYLVHGDTDTSES